MIPWPRKLPLRLLAARTAGELVVSDVHLARETTADYIGLITGALFETFVVTDVCKQTGWSERTVDLHHFRDHYGAEIDLVTDWQ